MNSAVYFDDANSRAIITVLQKYYSNLFNPANFVTGTTSATLNTYNGVVEYNQSIPAGTVTVFTLSNTNIIAANAKINPEIEYEVTGSAGTPVLVAIEVRNSTNELKIAIKNIHATDATDASVYFKFQLQH